MLRIFAVSAIGIALAAFVHAQTDPQPETRSCAAWSTGEFLPIASRLDVQACLDAGADINSQSENEFGLAPLHLAVVAKNTQAITALLKADANTEIQDYVSGQTPLHYTAKYGPHQKVCSTNYSKVELSANICLRLVSLITL